MQKEKTLHFWDDYYCKEASLGKEWILQPSSALVQQILDQLVIPNESTSPNESATDLHALEIGCGTSLLSVELCAAWEQRSSSSRSRLHVLATDVSPVCIEQQHAKLDRHVNAKAEHSDEAASKSTLAYQVLNITDPCQKDDSWKGKFDLILDKGCLDTCLFRSKKATMWLDTVLNNIHGWLKPKTGVYVIITPRSKLKAVRDFPGFVVSRRPLTAEHYGRGDLEPRSGCSTDQRKSNSHVQSNVGVIAEVTDSSALQQQQYLYSCRHVPLDGMARERVETTDSLPTASDHCPACRISFPSFRLQHCQTRDRADTYWDRHWVGHKLHCKGDV
jgi:SAM-dependent methyltransferase